MSARGIIAAVRSRDESLSRFVFDLKFGILDLLLMIPGCWFGMLTFVCTLWALVIASLVLQSHEFNVFVIIPLFGLCLLLWCGSLVSRFKLKYLIGPVSILTVPFPFIVLKSFESHPRYAQTHTQVIAFSTIVAVDLAILLLLKTLIPRTRPMCALKDHLDLSRRHPLLRHYIKSVGLRSETESFPSGDACIAASFCLTAFSCTNIGWIWMFALFAMFGRVYFWAHHLGDVIVGAVIGVAVAAVILLLVPHTMWSHGISWLAMLITVMCVRK
eukprot:c5038_g1_i1.p1 GENE.c5038_g1_i1~~c5038_g1_i1.p1  ORF type:complete len:272 (+),score=12.60 c5038_g1_i1:39-854(+)